MQLTANKTFQQLYVDTVKDNKVHVKELTGRNIDCFYFVQAERKDTGRMVVEYYWLLILVQGVGIGMRLPLGMMQVCLTNRVILLR